MPIYLKSKTITKIHVSEHKHHRQVKPSNNKYYYPITLRLDKLVSVRNKAKNMSDKK